MRTKLPVILSEAKDPKLAAPQSSLGSFGAAAPQDDGVRTGPQDDASRGVDIAKARLKLESLQGREYWRSLEELLDTDDFREHLHREFRVPIDSGVDRRQLLTLMGASIALAGLTGCTRQPTERIYPYVKAPEELVPGEPLYYATAQLHQGYARGVLAKSYEGRPIKVDGNELHPASLGGSDVFIQGYILNMYDPDRSQTLTERGQIKPWSALLAEIKLVLEQERARRGSGLRFLTTTVTSPTLQAQIAAVLAELPEAKWIAWEPAGCENVFAGTKLAFGEELQPVYLFDKADVVLSLEADFLGSGPSMPRYVHDFVSRRRGESMNRLYAVESTPTLTGARADHRRPLSPATAPSATRSISSRRCARAASLRRCRAPTNGSTAPHTSRTWSACAARATTRCRRATTRIRSCTRAAPAA